MDQSFSFAKVIGDLPRQPSCAIQQWSSPLPDLYSGQLQGDLLSRVFGDGELPQ